MAAQQRVGGGGRRARAGGEQQGAAAGADLCAGRRAPGARPSRGRVRTTSCRRPPAAPCRAAAGGRSAPPDCATAAANRAGSMRVSGAALCRTLAPLRQPVLRRGDDQVEVLERRLGVHEMHEPRRGRRTVAYPARHRRAAPRSGDHQIGPGRLRARDERRAVDAEHRRAEQEVGAVAEAVVDEVLRLVRPAERRGQAGHLCIAARAAGRAEPKLSARAVMRITRARRRRPARPPPPAASAPLAGSAGATASISRRGTRCGRAAVSLAAASVNPSSRRTRRATASTSRSAPTGAGVERRAEVARYARADEARMQPIEVARWTDEAAPRPAARTDTPNPAAAAPCPWPCAGAPRRAAPPIQPAIGTPAAARGADR